MESFSSRGRKPDDTPGNRRTAGRLVQRVTNYAYTYNANGPVTRVDNQGAPKVPRVVLTTRHVERYATERESHMQ
ncbi:MAG: hypothetical protein NT069_20415 [Planctomycetota bacterium]|nr:hypothetical protein [Planctomycetota bacterium]